MKATRILAAVIALAAATSALGASSLPIVDEDQRADIRARALVAKMTLEEKIQMVHGAILGPLNKNALGGGGYIPGIPRLGIPDQNMIDSASGLNGMFKAFKEPLTLFPATIGLAATWDESLSYDFGKRLGKQLRAMGFSEGLGGGLNLAREPRNGRTFEYLGEDPVLAGKLTSARTQGTHSEHVIATVKHYALNNQETLRYTSNSVVDERTLRELYLLGFEIAVKEGKPTNIMCAYNLVNGDKACENKMLITDILKNEWGYKAKVQSDWIMAVTDTVKAANAGLDEEEPGGPDDYQSPKLFGFEMRSYFNQKLKAAIESGKVPMARLDDMVGRRLFALYRSGVMDNPPQPGGAIDEAGDRAFALKVAEQSMVLLKNAAPTGEGESVLPLNGGKLRSIAVIGGHADVATLFGGGSGSAVPRGGNPVKCLNPAAKLPPGLMSACAAWFRASPLEAIRTLAPNATISYLDGTDAVAAAEAAAAADVAIVFGVRWESEDRDTPSLALADASTDATNLDYDQNRLIAAVAAKARKTVVVLETGSAVTMPWLDSVQGVLQAWYPGELGAQAIANILFGQTNPSAKLPLTFPKREADLPQPVIAKTDTQVVYEEKLLMGYRWYDAKKIEPLFPFGYGLSYTTFRLSELKLRPARGGGVSLSVKVSNTGRRAGIETAQVYASLPAAAGEPPQRLVAWKKVPLGAGESTIVRLEVPAERLAVWNVDKHRWQMPAGAYRFRVANSSRGGSEVAAPLVLRSR